MNALKRKRTQLRREFSTLDKNFLTELRNGQETVEEAYTALSDIYEALFNVEAKIVDMFCESEDFSEAIFEEDQDKALEYKQRWAEAKAKYQKYKQSQTIPLARHNSQISLTSHVSDLNTVYANMQPQRKNVKMPKLELSKFDGEVKNWIQFWGQFQKIHEDANTDDIDKFQYLIQSTVENSPARQLIMSYPPSAANYPKAIEALKARFARDDMLIETYVRGLLSLVWSQLKGEMCSLPHLYDSLQTHLQALETLNVTKDKFASVLYPMIESALPEDLLRSWNRMRARREHTNDDSDDELNRLMSFIKNEVESEERITMARQGFSQLGLTSTSSGFPPTACFVSETKKYQIESKKGQTSSSMSNIISTQCLWCGKNNHSSVECHKAERMSPKERLEFVKAKKACQICLKQTHTAKRCKSFPKCIICKKRHVALLCQNLLEKSDLSVPESRTNELICQLKSTTLLQTLVVKVITDKREIFVRALIDSGAQRSYIKKELANELELKPIHKEKITHSLFGGVETNTEEHPVYNIHLKSLCNNFSIFLSVLGQQNICGVLPKVRSDVIIEQLRDNGITLTDSTATPDDVTLLIGADFSGTLMTGNFLHLKNNLTAVQTKMGWTIQGSITGVFTATATNLYCSSHHEISDLWDLEVLGIRDPSEYETRRSREIDVLKHFNDTVHIDQEHRYEVYLPWCANAVRPMPNYEVAFKRLLSTTKRLVSISRIEDYNAAFNEWLSLGIIERAPCQTINTGHFIPHHAVIKESSMTTKIRPVFDASTKDMDGISLNSCLEKGINLIELIPNLLIDFRKEAIGVTADIAKAFLQISLRPEDRDYLKFLWWSDIDDTDRTIVIYRHKRVVFGVKSSPFHLAATIAYHLNHVDNRLKETAMKLKKSFYIDNCVTSISSVDATEKFKSEAIEVMREGMFDLRCWMTAPYRSDETSTASVLGVVWNLDKDELSCNVKSIGGIREVMTKRCLLSIVHQIFDPIGIYCPTTIIPKMILQKSWATKLSWDAELPPPLQEEFKRWAEHLYLLGNISIPRRLTRNDISTCENSLHVFCDASQAAYAACVFLRSELNGDSCVRIVMAKARVTPAKNITIPRLELIAATLATRLANTVIEALSLRDCPVFYWTDSNVVLCWIKGDGDWSVFVVNRVREIRASSSKDAWRHVPGVLNPADLPSRGVSVKSLLESKWWNGPSWLLDTKEWPVSDLPFHVTNEERRKPSVKSMLVEDSSFICRFTYFSSYTKILRMVGWILRLKYKCYSVLHTELSCDEIDRAEIALHRLIQLQHIKKFSNLHTFIDINGIIRLNTKLAHMDEAYDFRAPIVLPACDTIVQRLISEQHKTLQHAGAQTLMIKLRERFWIIGLRRIVKRIIKECIICKRHKAKPQQTPPAHLPKERTQAIVPFQFTGVDLAGPLFLRSQSKCWIVLFTCATYRAVHLEVAESLSSEEFILALRRFIARRGRIQCLFSDNGTNFVGVQNMMNALDWNKIVAFSNIQKIKWHFAPPSAPWWGGFFERLNGVVKNMLVRVLGRASVTLTELQTVLCDCEATINNRPLTYFSNNTDELRPLTPSLFIQPLAGSNVEDLDEIDSTKLNMRAKYRQTLRDNFRQRFRNEYVCNLIQQGSKQNGSVPLKPGDIVLVESNNKRLLWPLAVVEETYTGRDGHERVAKVRTASGYKINDGAAMVFADEFKQTLERYVFGICPQNFRMQLNLKSKNGSVSAPACDLDADHQDLAARLATLSLRAHAASRSECSRLGVALANMLGELARTANRAAIAAANSEAVKKRKLSKSQKAKIQAKQRTALAVKKKAAAAAAAAAKMTS